MATTTPASLRIEAHAESAGLASDRVRMAFEERTRARRGIPPSRIRVNLLRRVRVELSFDQRLNLQPGVDNLRHKGTECSPVRDDRHAHPRCVLARTFDGVRFRHDVLLAIPFQATVRWVLAAEEETATRSQVLSDES